MTFSENQQNYLQMKLWNLYLYYVAASPKTHVPVTAAIIRFNHDPCYTALNTETFRRKSTLTFVSLNIPFLVKSTKKVIFISL